MLDRADLKQFLETRSSFIAQTSLYGYLRTRAGQIYPQLFEDDEFVQQINVAKWHVWLACLSDLSVFAGGLLAHRSQGSPEKVGILMNELVGSILDETGTPADAGEEFAERANRVRARVAGCLWNQLGDDDTAFSESPAAVVRWAPVVENLKELDEDIVKNSVRFRWNEVRRDLRTHLDAEAVLGSSS